MQHRTPFDAWKPYIYQTVARYEQQSFYLALPFCLRSTIPHPLLFSHLHALTACGGRATNAARYREPTLLTWGSSALPLAFCAVSFFGPASASASPSPPA